MSRLVWNATGEVSTQDATHIWAVFNVTVTLGSSTIMKLGGLRCAARRKWKLFGRMFMLTAVCAPVVDAPGAGAGSVRVLKSVKASRLKVAFAGRNRTMREPSR